MATRGPISSHSGLWLQTLNCPRVLPTYKGQVYAPASLVHCPQFCSQTLISAPQPGYFTDVIKVQGQSSSVWNTVLGSLGGAWMDGWVGGETEDETEVPAAETTVTGEG